MRESTSKSWQLTNYTHNSDYEQYSGMYGHNSDYDDRGGIYAHNSDCGGMFIMKHRANSMSDSTSSSALNPEDVWFVDSGAWNHMTGKCQSHKEWFLELRELERPGYVETGDDTTHPIRHIGNVPFGEKGKKTCIKNINLHVPTITKNFVSVGQMVEQGMQVRFDQDGCHDMARLKPMTSWYMGQDLNH